MISANVRLALRCRSIFSENTRVLSALSGSPWKKSVSPRCIHQHGPIHQSTDAQIEYQHFRDIEADRQRPLVRCRRARARTVHRGTSLRTSVQPVDRLRPSLTSAARRVADSHDQTGGLRQADCESRVSWVWVVDSRSNEGDGAELQGLARLAAAGWFRVFLAEAVAKVRNASCVGEQETVWSQCLSRQCSGRKTRTGLIKEAARHWTKVVMLATRARATCRNVFFLRIRGRAMAIRRYGLYGSCLRRKF